MKYTLKLNIVVSIIKNRNKNSNGMKTISGKALIFLTYENWLTASHVKCTQCENPKWFESIGLQNYWLLPAVSRGIHGLTHLTELPEFFSEFICSNFLGDISPFCTSSDTCFGLPAKSDPGFKSRVDPFTWMLRHLLAIESSDFFEILFLLMIHFT